MYQEKLTAGHTADQTMFNLSWDVEELKNIHEDCRKLYTELSCCINFCTDRLFHSHNAPNKLTKIRSKLCEVVKRIAHFRRNPATHVFVLMVSSETREKKPYSLPVQCIPYSGLKEVELRRLVSDLCKEMTSLGLKVSGSRSKIRHYHLYYMYIFSVTGFVSDGEFNFLRAKGYTGPLSVFQVRSNVRNLYSRMSSRKMLGMITPKGKPHRHTYFTFCIVGNVTYTYKYHLYLKLYWTFDCV